MKENDLPPLMPAQCRLHALALEEMREDVKMIRVAAEDVKVIKIAVCGDKELRIHGLARDVEELKEWRRLLDLRAAGIAGAVSALISLGKYLFN